MPTLISLLYTLTCAFLSSGTALTLLAWYDVTPESAAALMLGCGFVTTLTLTAETMIRDA